MVHPKKLAIPKSRSGLRTQMDFKGIKVETKAKLKLMSANRGVHLYQLLDEIVDEAFEKEQRQLVRPGVSSKIRRWVRKLLRAQVQSRGSVRQ